jgi:hypothetical protein
VQRELPVRAAILEGEDVAALGACQNDRLAREGGKMRAGLTSFDLASGYQKSG